MKIQVYFFDNGNTAIFDEDGNQMTTLQKSWFELFLDYLSRQGVDIDNIEFNLPNEHKAEPFKVEDEYNWRIV